MRVYWEKIGVLLPIYRLVGRGCSDREIATRLGISKVAVEGCVSWMLNFLGLENRGALQQHAVPVEAHMPLSRGTRPRLEDNFR